MRCLLGAMLLLAGIARAQPYGMTSRAAVGPYMNGRLPVRAPNAATGWTVVNAFPNLTFKDPTFFVPEPRSNRIYVGTLWGVIHRFTNDPATGSAPVFLDLSNRTQVSDNSGLLAMAFHPEFGQAGSPNRGYIYVYYQYAETPVYGYRPSYNRLSRFTVPDGSAVADRNSELVLINQFDPHVWHNGGGLCFGNDGFLYLSLGEAGGAGDAYNVTQKINFALFSGVLRIDVDRNPARSHPIRRQPQSTDPASPSFTANYFIPDDNPFLDPAGGTLEEFYAIGLRSPHRMTVDPPTGQIWFSDVGENTYEEINLLRKGANYGWAFREGLGAGPKPRPDPVIGTEEPPAYSYRSGDGNNSAIGGYVYRGREHAAFLDGMYLFGDNGSGRIWAWSPAGGDAVLLANLPPGLGINGLCSFGLDANGEIYMVKLGSSGRIYKLARSTSSEPSPPARLSDTGVFSNVATLTPAATLVPYDVNSPLWSDGADKRRWMAVPNDGAPYGASEKISFAAQGAWGFPNGTVFVKHFEIPTDETNPSVVRRLETRLLVRDADGGVYGLTYKWRPDGTDADLLAGSLNEDITIRTASGTRTQTWFYPSRQACLSCHTPTADHVLGVNTRQLNGLMTYPSGVRDNQVRTLNQLGLFSPTLSETEIPQLEKLVPVSDAAASLEHRVRSYFDANCSHCHQPGGTPAFFDARFSTPLGQQGIINGPLATSLGGPDARVVASSSVPNSLTHFRMNTVDTVKMPPLSRNVIDLAAVNTLAEWIATLRPPEPLPSGWSHGDVGNVLHAGDAVYSGGSLTVSGSGEDIWGSQDAFHFFYRTLTGDGEIVARVTSIQPTSDLAKAGVMFRESLATGARNAFMALTPTQGVMFQRRDGTSTTAIHPPEDPRPPTWVRVVRNGSNFSGYYSADGTNWTLAGTMTVTLPATAMIGLAVTGHEVNALGSATFENVRVVAAGSPAPAAPAAPSNLRVTAISNSQIDLNWTDNSSGEEAFAIERAAAGGSFVFVASVPANTTTFANAGLAAGTSYSYRVRATRFTGNSGYSNVATIATPSLGGSPPAAPTGLSATANSASQITLTWTDASTNENGFEVERSTDNITFIPRTTTAGGATMFVDTGLAAATTYYYRVRAVHGAGASAFSNVASAQTQTALIAPTALTATAVGANRIDLSWAENSPNEDGFRIERASGGSAFAQIAITGANVTAFSDASVMAATSYAYRVRASYGINSSGYSNEASAITPSTSSPDWARADVGAVAVAGSDDMSVTPAVVRGSGSDIWEGADAFHFVYRALTGDGSIQARVTALTDTHSWAKAGVMIRESLAPGARNTFMLVSSRNGVAAQNRATAGGVTTSTSGASGLTAPYWVRLTRTGNSIVASASPDGAAWTTVASFTVSFGSEALFGLAVTSHNNAVLCTGSFTNIAVSGGAPPPPPVPPAAPTNLTATATSASQIALTWTDASNNETGFEIERSTDNVTFAPRSTVAAGNAGFADTGLAPATTYYYRVRAVNGAGASAYSNVANAQTQAAPPPPSVPAAPTGLSATANSASQITLAWTDASSNETGFEVERSVDNLTFAPRTTTAAGATSFADTGLAAATTYYYRVRAVNGAGASGFSNVANAQTQPAGPPPPTPTWIGADIGTVGVAGSHQIDGTSATVRGSGGDIWDGADAFRFVYQTLSGDGVITAQVTTVANTHAWAKAGVMIRTSLAPNAANVFAFLTPANGYAVQHRAAPGASTTSTHGPWGVGLPYWVRLARTGNSVIASVSANGTAWTVVATHTLTGTELFVGLATTSHNNAVLGSATLASIALTTGGAPPPPPTAPAAPTGLSATANSASQITLAWTDASTNETGFEVERSSDNISFAPRTTTAAGAASFVDTGLAAATTYYYRVRAVNGAGPSAYSNVANAQTQAAPPPPSVPAAPTGLSATANSASQITLAWTDASSNETGFEVERSLDNVTFAPRSTTAAGATSFVDSGLAAATTYYYRVRAVNGAGPSAYSNVANAQTQAAPPPPSVPAAPTGLSATANSASQITLAWTDASSNETGFEVERSADNVTFAARTTTAAGVASFVDSGLAAATTYYYRVRAVNAAGASPYSNVANARTADAPPPPPAWQTRDIGAVGRPGSVAPIDGGIALTGSGEDIWNNVDEFRYYYQALTGDGELIARVTSLTPTHGWAKAGIMFRESLDAGAAHALMCVSAEHGTAFQYRAATGGPSGTSTPTEAGGAIRWIRVVRSGNTISGYESENGTSWTLASSRTFAFPGTIFVGLAVTSHNDSASCTATFTNIALNAGSPPPPPPVTVNAPSGLAARAASSAQIDLTWTDNATNETGFQIERAIGSGTFGALAAIGADRTGYSDATVTAGTSYSYRVRAMAGTTASSFSNTASATPTAAPPPPPPPTWSFGDIGAVGVSGSNSSSGNTITIRGSGQDIWGTADGFRFVYQAVTGDGVVEAQVTSLQNTNGWAKAGVMIRESLTAGSRNAFAFVSPDHGVNAQAREATGGETRSVAGPARPAPYWVRVTRSGTTFTAASSPDGVAWTTFATFTMPMNATAYFGFVVTSHDNSQLSTAVFADPFLR